MANIKTQFKGIETKLKELGVQELDVTLIPPQQQKKLAALEKKFKFSLPRSLKEYYLATNGHFITWSLPKNGIAGSSSVLDINSFFTNRTTTFYHGQTAHEIPYYSASLSEEQKKVLDEEYFVFERVYIDTFVLVSRKESHEEAVLYLLEYPFMLTRLDLTFEEYLIELLKNMALLNWQQQYRIGSRDEALIAKFNSDAKELQAKAQNKSGAPKEKATPYRERLEELVHNLRSNQKVAHVQFDRYFAAPPINVFRKIEQTFKQPLPEEMVKFYSEVNGFKLVWRTVSEIEPAASGIIDVPPLERAFGGQYYRLATDWDDYVTYGILWDEELAEAFPEDFRAVTNKRIFDRHLSRNQILMELAGGRASFFYYIDRGVIKLKVSFEELVETMLSTAGVEYYPELLRKGTAKSHKKFIDDLVERIKVVNPTYVLK